jgi:glycosyltransferase involved in cell wall biosynthesis
MFSNDVRLYAYECAFGDMQFIKVSTLGDVAFSEHFQNSELIIFHFGIYYPLFDLLPVAPKRAKRLVVFHNITPKQFVAPRDHPLMDKSLKQMSNILFADHVICDSTTNLNVLRDAGIEVPAIVLPVAVHCHNHLPEQKPSHLDGIIRICFIGRFVSSKGPNELLRAIFQLLRRSSTIRLRLDMIGNLAFSDSCLLEELRTRILEIHRSFERRGNVELHGNATEKLKAELLRDSDLFVLPTYHEGFCVPIVEALASGVRVIAYDNSNTPAISGGLATLVPTGDVSGLETAIENSICEVVASAWRGSGRESYREYARKAAAYAQQYRPEGARRRFLNFIRTVS